MRFKFFASAIAALALASCSNNEDVLDNNQQQEENSVAFLKVNIGYGNGASSRGTSNGYEDSSTEHAINNADFYFYANDGSFYTKISKGAINDTNNTTGDAPNIEAYTTPILAIEKTTNRFPGYLLVVLNNKDEDLSNKSLADAAVIIGTWDVASIGENGTGFIMTNSTYDGTKGQGTYLTDAAGQYFATPITADDFYTSETEALQAEKAVDVYVERLAAKVTLNMGNDVTSATTDAGITIENVKTADANDKDQVTIKITGWGLNGTEKKSYLMKKINAGWTFNTPDWNKAWNDVANRRSHWAISPNYTFVDNNYPANFEKATKGNKTTGTDQMDATNYALNYVSYDELGNTVGTYEYCRENTLSEAHLTNAKFLSTATSVLIAAEITGAENEDYFLYGETLYKSAEFKKAVMDMYKNELDDYMTANGTDNDNNTQYRSLTVNDIQFVSPYDGYITIALTNEAAGKTWGTISEENGNKTFTPCTSDTDKEDELAKLIDKINTELLAAKIQGFKGGKMYYNIPIEHLGQKDNEEGRYGVVRNNMYEITVNSIKKLGRGVYNPSEDIIPNEQTPTLYYLAAEIKVLSWHKVQQGADL